MRVTTKFLNASLALSALMVAAGNSLSVQLAQTQEPQNSLPLSQAPQPEASPSSQPTAESPATKPLPAKTTQAAPQPSATGAQQPKPITLVSDPIPYKYGEVQLQLTKTDALITDIKVLIGDTSYGRDVAYQSLIAATLQTQGTNYGNVSGATFTTDAFKQAVQNALSKG